MIDLKMFTTEEELSNLTGLDHKQLWKQGFELDDWDYGFCSSVRLSNEKKAELFINFMDTYCCGYREYECHGNYYILLYHS